MKKTTQLKNMLLSKELEFLIEAHSGLSARIAEEAGFKGLWASGLSISSQLGVRDNNEASWTQVLEVVEFMNDAVAIPILLDGDTGYGNFNNVRRLVRKMCQRDIAGVCIEDKQFPKTNSFIQGERQPLADMQEFCGRIKAGKDSQTDPDFCVVARVEALIAGWGIDEALKRAGAYADAGADAVLIHSKLSKPDEILQFAQRWKRPVPIVIVPTKYFSTPAHVFRKAGISTVIWANHLLRSSLASMQRTAARIREEESVMGVEDAIAPLEEVFRLQGAHELLEAEKLYLNETGVPVRAIVLAASRGEAFAELTRRKPKGMLSVAGKPILERLIESLRGSEVRDISVVVGYGADTVDISGIVKIANPRYESSGELASLGCAIDRVSGTTLVLYGDIVFRKSIIRDVLERPEDIVIVVDSGPADTPAGIPLEDRVLGSLPDSWDSWQERITLKRIGAAEGAPFHGQWAGIAKVSGAGCDRLREAFGRLRARADFDALTLPALIQDLVDHGSPVSVMYIRGHWVNVNQLMDIDKARSIVQP